MQQSLRNPLLVLEMLQQKLTLINHGHKVQVQHNIAYSNNIDFEILKGHFLYNFFTDLLFTKFSNLIN